MKVSSCGVILTDGEVLLSIIPWGKKTQRDIPKGRADPGERPVDTAIREAREETGLVLSEDELIDLGSFEYTEFKDLHVFLCYREKLPSLSLFTCESYFMNEFGKDVPEAVGYEYLQFTDSKFYFKLQRILRDVKKGLTT